MSTAQALGNFLQENKKTISLAESITAGLALHKLANIKGASEFLKGGIVCYQENLKISLLKVKAKTLEKYTAESQEVTEEMVKNLKNNIEADVYAAITGLASAGGSETKLKPVGTVFFAVYYNNHIYNLRKKFNGSPLQIKNKACNSLFEFILKNIKNNTA